MSFLMHSSRDSAVNVYSRSHAAVIPLMTPSPSATSLCWCFPTPPHAVITKKAVLNSAVLTNRSYPMPPKQKV